MRSSGRGSLQVLDELGPGDAGHHRVGQHEVERSLLDNLQRVGCRSRPSSPQSRAVGAGAPSALRTASSSSTKRMRVPAPSISSTTSLDVVRIQLTEPAGEGDLERRSFFDLGEHLDPAFHAGDDRLHGREPEAGAFTGRFRGHEGLEHSLAYVGHDAGAGVGHGQDDAIVLGASSSKSIAVAIQSTPPPGIASRALTAKLRITCSRWVGSPTISVEQSVVVIWS